MDWFLDHNKKLAITHMHVQKVDQEERYSTFNLLLLRKESKNGLVS